MHFLVSNDDGYLAPGIAALADALDGLGKVSVVAPERNRSGASHSLTLDTPLRVHGCGIDRWFVNGTPTDCVHLALTGLLEERPHMVLGGINAGENLGDDVLYSGTVAVAIEGRFLGLPSVALSLAGDEPTHYDTAARVARLIVRRLLAVELPADTILNVNVPDVPFDALRGVAVTRLGHRHESAPALRAHDPRGRPVYWVGPAGPEQDAGPGTDFHAVRKNFVSVTPLQVDLTRHSALDNLQRWFVGVTLNDA